MSPSAPETALRGAGGDKPTLRLPGGSLLVTKRRREPSPAASPSPPLPSPSLPSPPPAPALGGRACLPHLLAGRSLLQLPANPALDFRLSTARAGRQPASPHGRPGRRGGAVPRDPEHSGCGVCMCVRGGCSGERTPSGRREGGGQRRLDLAQAELRGRPSLAQRSACPQPGSGKPPAPPAPVPVQREQTPARALPPIAPGGATRVCASAPSGGWTSSGPLDAAPFRRRAPSPPAAAELLPLATVQSPRPPRRSSCSRQPCSFPGSLREQVSVPSRQGWKCRQDHRPSAGSPGAGSLYGRLCSCGVCSLPLPTPPRSGVG